MRLVLALATGLVGCSQGENPQWVEDGRTANASLYSEAKIERPTRNRSLIAMRSLNDYDSEQRLASGETYLSLVYTGLYNCADRSWAVTHAQFFVAPMGKGSRVHIDSVSLDDALKNMKAYADGSPAQVHFVNACARGLKQ
jgi:hypothetical protein